MPDVVVVGGGLSGLACGQALVGAGREVVVLDRNDRPGGVVQTHALDGFLVESGPNTILPTPESMDIIRDAGLESEIVPARPRLPRFIYVDGRLRRAPWVLSVAGTLRVLSEPFVRKRDHVGDEALADFCIRRFGAEAHDRLLSPFVGGIYAGDTRELSVEGTFPKLAELERRYGSIVLGALRTGRDKSRPRLSSFRGGMAALPVAIASRLDFRGNVSGVRVSPMPGGWRIDSSEGALRTPCVVLALPAYGVGQCLNDAELLGYLAEIRYAPIVVASWALDSAQVDAEPKGFGFLVPRTEGLRVLGTLFNSSLFPDRAPEGKILLTSFLGGTHDPESVAWDDARIWEQLENELRQVLRFRGGIRPLRLDRYPRGIPQYRVGHRRWREKIRHCVAARPGLFLTGNYLDGVSVPLTLEHGRETGKAAHRYLGHVS